MHSSKYNFCKFKLLIWKKLWEIILKDHITPEIDTFKFFI